MNYLINTMFANRGYTPEFIADINRTDMDQLKDIDLLCKELFELRQQNKHIVVLTDFDLDGITSGIIGFAGLAELGFRVSLFIPTPSDGYGFDAETITSLLTQYPDADVIITGDVGIDCHTGIAFATERGISVLVTDHHPQKKVNLNARAIVNPNRLDETYSMPDICGANVMYKVMEHYAKTYCNMLMVYQIQRLRVFAGFGTISDMMPLRYENRQLIRDTLSIARLVCSNGDDFLVRNITGCDIYRRAFYGLHKFLCSFFDLNKLKSVDDITEMFIGYYVSPTFNSIKRMDGDLSRAYGIFFGANVDADITYMHKLNAERKLEVDYRFEELSTIDQPFAPYIYFSNARAGILGLLANNLQQISGLPTLVVAKNGTRFKGSGRSPGWYLAMSRLTDVGFWAAGHNPAFGVGFSDLLELKSCFAFLQRDVAEVYATLDKEILSTRYDFVIANDNSGDVGIDILMFAEYMDELKRYAPFGVSFPSPNVLLKIIPSQYHWSVMGGEKQHLKLQGPMGLCVLVWNDAKNIELKDSTNDLYLTGHLDISEFLGNHTVNFIGKFLQQ